MSNPETKSLPPPKVHSTAIVEDGAAIGDGTQVWHFCHVRTGTQIGQQCILGKGVFVDSGTVLGDRVKVQNHVSIYRGVTIESGVFIGPHVCFTNDKLPRAVNPDHSQKSAHDWVEGKTLVKKGVSIGANATIVTGITLGEWSMVGAGSVVTRDVPPYALVQGNPARIVGQVDASGNIVKRNR
jgi:UDP-2-acetamido-3-amino-2,3-dideoxy-glucuronate N-acetyltransferase